MYLLVNPYFHLRIWSLSARNFLFANIHFDDEKYWQLNKHIVWVQSGLATRKVTSLNCCGGWSHPGGGRWSRLFWRQARWMVDFHHCIMSPPGFYNSFLQLLLCQSPCVDWFAVPSFCICIIFQNVPRSSMPHWSVPFTPTLILPGWFLLYYSTPTPPLNPVPIGYPVPCKTWCSALIRVLSPLTPLGPINLELNTENPSWLFVKAVLVPSGTVWLTSGQQYQQGSAAPCQGSLEDTLNSCLWKTWGTGPVPDPRRPNDTELCCFEGTYDLSLKANASYIAFLNLLHAIPWMTLLHMYTIIL